MTQLEVARQYASRLREYASRLRGYGGSAVVEAYTCDLDNYEPRRRRTTHGYMVFYDLTDRGIGGIWLPRNPDLAKIRSAIVIIDDRWAAVPFYVDGYHHNPHPEFNFGMDTPYTLLAPFPRSEGRRQDNGRQIDMTGWRLGPRTCYHFEVRKVEDDDPQPAEIDDSRLGQPLTRS